MALWRVLELYKRADSRRGQAPAENKIDTVKWNTQSRADRGVLAKPLGVRPENRRRLYLSFTPSYAVVFYLFPFGIFCTAQNVFLSTVSPLSVPCEKYLQMVFCNHNRIDKQTETQK